MAFASRGHSGLRLTPLCARQPRASRSWEPTLSPGPISASPLQLSGCWRPTTPSEQRSACSARIARRAGRQDRRPLPRTPTSFLEKPSPRGTLQSGQPSPQGNSTVTAPGLQLESAQLQSRPAHACGTPGQGKPAEPSRLPGTPGCLTGFPPSSQLHPSLVALGLQRSLPLWERT